MFLADELPNGAWIGGFVILLGAIIRSITSDLTWRNVIKEIRAELSDCRQGRESQAREHGDERAVWRSDLADMGAKCKALEGEVTVLRNQIHADRWAGIDPASRSKLYDQAKGQDDG